MLDRKRRVKTTISPPLTFNLKVDFTFSVPSFWRGAGGEAVIFIMITFSIRSYTKKELSLMYFPDSIPTTAVKHLMGWIKRCTPLMGELQAMGYHTSNKTFTPRQVKAIVEQLGEP